MPETFGKTAMTAAVAMPQLVISPQVASSPSLLKSPMMPMKAQEQSKGHRVADESELLLKRAGVGFHLVEPELVEKEVERHGQDTDGRSVQRGDGAVWVAVVGGPALRYDLGAEERVKLLNDHAGHGEPEVLGEDEEARSPCKVGEVVPEVAGLEDRRISDEVEDDLERDCHGDVDHAHLIGIGDERRRHGAQVDDRSIDAYRIDHVADDGREDWAKRTNDKVESFEADACAECREERLLWRDSHCESNHEDEYGHEDGSFKRGEERIQCSEHDFLLGDAW